MTTGAPFDPDERASRLAALRRRYLDTVFESVLRLQSRLGVEPRQDADRNDFRLAIHSLKGSGGAYGFPEITDRAARVEQALLSGCEPRVVADGLGELLGAVCGATHRAPFDHPFDHSPEAA